MQSGALIRKWILAGGGLHTLLVFTVMIGLMPGSSGALPNKEPAGQAVDSGSFAVFMGGRRVATETFSIHQSSTGSAINSEFKSEAGTEKADQSSELRLTEKGDLLSYEWKELSPGQSQATVTPNADFLTERFAGAQGKMIEQPFLLPASTSVLDDYFFVQREVLAWKYLASSCKQEKGQIQCPMKQRTQLGAINPHARSSLLVSVEFSGREKVEIHGAERELIRLDMKSDSGDWTLWLDDQLKLQRILVPGDNTEVVRD